MGNVQTGQQVAFAKKSFVIIVGKPFGCWHCVAQAEICELVIERHRQILAWALAEWATSLGGERGQVTSNVDRDT